MEPDQNRNAEGPLPAPNDRAGSWTNGVPLGTSHSGGKGSATSYPQKANGTNKRPGEEINPVQRKEPFWPGGKYRYTEHHSG